MCKCTKSTENAARHFPHAYAPAIDGRVPADLAGVTFGDCFVNYVQLHLARNVQLQTTWLHAIPVHCSLLNPQPFPFLLVIDKPFTARQTNHYRLHTNSKCSYDVNVFTV